MMRFVFRGFTIAVAAALFAANASAQSVELPTRLGARIGVPESISSIARHADGWLMLSDGYDSTLRMRTTHVVRIDRNGVIDRDGERVLPTGRNYGLSSIGGTAMLVWLNGSALFASTLRTDGSLQDPEGKILLAGIPADVNWTVNCDDAHCFAAWTMKYPPDSARDAVIFDGDGRVTKRVALPAGSLSCLATDHDGFLLRAGGRLVRIDDSGAVTFDIAVADVELADFDGRAYTVVTAHEATTTSDSSAAMRRLTIDGRIGDERPLSMVLTHARLAFGWNGSRHLLMWAPITTPPISFEGSYGSLDVFAIRFDETLAPVDASPLTLVSNGDNASMQLAGMNGWFFVGWLHSRLFQAITRTAVGVGARISATGGIGEREALVRMPIQQYPAAIVTNETESLVVWTEVERTDNRASLRAMRISNSGIPLDDEPIVLDDVDDFVTIIGVPKVAALGSDMVVVWSSGNPSDYTGPPPVHHFALIHADGRVDRRELQRGEFSRVATASDGNSMLLDNVGSLTSGNFYLSRITRSGAYIPVSFPISDHIIASALASNGRGFLLVTIVNNCRKYPCGPSTVVAHLLDGEGRPVGEPRPFPELTGRGIVALASNGRDYLLLTRSEENGRLETARIGADGQLLAPLHDIWEEDVASSADSATLVAIKDGWLLIANRKSYWDYVTYPGTAVLLDRDGRQTGAPFPAGGVSTLFTGGNGNEAFVLMRQPNGPALVWTKLKPGNGTRPRAGGH